SPPGFADCPGSQAWLCDWMTTVWSARRASTPPWAATPALTRSRPCWACAGAIMVAPENSATDKNAAYRIAIPPWSYRLAPYPTSLSGENPPGRRFSEADRYPKPFLNGGSVTSGARSLSASRARRHHDPHRLQPPAFPGDRRQCAHAAHPAHPAAQLRHARGLRGGGRRLGPRGLHASHSRHRDHRLGDADLRRA